jgi:hypothetical protein
MFQLFYIKKLKLSNKQFINILDNKMPLTRFQKKNVNKNLISATRISNSIKNDKILDYLDILDENGLTLSENLVITKKRSKSFDYFDINNSTEHPNKKKKTSFDYIVENGYLFENDIIDKIKQMMVNNGEISKIIDIDEKNININCTKTIETIIKNKHSIILGSVVINSLDNTWGKPDLIVKGCWINKYICDKIIGININKWYIIDIKSSTIQLINGGEDISSKLLYSVYKSQIYVYTQALNYLLNEKGFNNNINIGFILGKKYKYILNKNQIIKNPFDCIAIIDFEKERSKGIYWNNIINSSVEWINDLRNNWTKFNLNPINRDELYPNMKNSYNKNWYGIKKKVAFVNKEITSLWNCGLINRDKAWAKGIKSYMDTNLTCEILGFDKYSSKYKIIQSMLNLLHNKNKNYILDKKNNFMVWQEKVKWEFFIDFETYSCNDIIYDEANEWDNIYNSDQKIYMCGISWINSNTNKFSHKTFIINYNQINSLNEEFRKNTNNSNNDINNDLSWNNCICCLDELDLIIKMKNFIMGFKPKKMNNDEFFNKSRLIHWSSAEPIIINKKINEYQLNKTEFKLNWYDLLNVFKYQENPIIIKECFGFGLKNIVKKLNQLSEINIDWSDLDDGLLSSFIARDIYDNKNNNSNKNMYDIIKYNLIDCKAMLILIEWMRKSVK